MLFTDLFFLFYFLPAVLILLRLTHCRPVLNNLFRLCIILVTLVFYAYENWLWVGIFLCTSVGTYAWAFFISRSRHARIRKILLCAALIQCVGSLAIFKYLNWLAGIFPALEGLRHYFALVYGNASGAILLPPGISFFTFEAISFLVDLYRKKIELPRNPLNYFTFITMFPRFIAGPIVRYTDVKEQFARWSGMAVAQGLTLFSIGFIIKVAFADQFARFVSCAFGVVHPDLIQSWIGTLAYTFQLYFDFWGYSIMATGLGLCMGFQFPDNFHGPYRSLSITEFWRLWHISLSSWLRDYLYFAMGGSRCAKWRRYFNLLATMVLGGLWHGASFSFVVWGFYHGFLLCLERWIGVDRMGTWPRILRWTYAFLAVMAGWVVFRAKDFSQAVDVYQGLVGCHGVLEKFNPVLFEKYGFSLSLCLLGLLFCMFGEKKLIREEGLQAVRFSLWKSVGIWACFCVALLIRLSEDSIPFLYFQF